MTAISKDLIEINLSTDELMLNELERRDGIYSFIFHELEVPKDEMATVCISPGKIINNNYITTTTRKTPITIINTAATEDEAAVESNESDNSSSSSSNEMGKLIENVIENEEEPLTDSANNTKMSTTITTTTNLPFFTSSSPSSFVSTFPTISISSSSASSPVTATTITTTTTSSTTTTTTIYVPSLFTTTTTLPLHAPFSTASTTSVPFSNGFNTNPLPCLPSLSGGISMRNYHNYLKTWHPPPSLLYDNPKLYAYMANCGFRVRVATPRFSHISAPLVRNRRHALKETPEYKRMCDMYLCAPVADLRTLFPHDPDVHAPFTMATEVITTGTTTSVLEEDCESIELDDGCCSDVVFIASAMRVK